jgi:hypothetical protein
MSKRVVAATDDQKRLLVFHALQPSFSQVLSHSNSSDDITRVLCAVLEQLKRDICLREHLHVCLDYALFPFQLMLPAIAATRKQMPAKKNASSQTLDMKCSFPAMRSAIAAEKALQAFEVILSLAPPETVEQITAVVHILAEIVHIQPSESYNEDMCLYVLKAARSTFSARVIALSWPASQEHQAALAYMVHGLLKVAENERLGKGFGVLTLRFLLACDNVCSRQCSARKLTIELF